jgi:hypothetical protein
MSNLLGYFNFFKDFLRFFFHFFKILMYQSSAHFSGSFRMKGKSRKTFDIILSTKSGVFKIPIWWGCSPSPHRECATA